MARGCIYRQPKRSGGFTYYIKYRTSDGTQVKRAAGPARKEAERALNAALAAVDRGDQRTTSRETFEEAAWEWLVAKRPRIEPATFRDYGFHLEKRLIPAFGWRKLRSITRAHIEAYIAELAAAGELSRAVAVTGNEVLAVVGDGTTVRYRLRALPRARP